MSGLGRIVKYAWFHVVTRLTAWWPDFKFLMRLRGLLVCWCFAECGRNFQIASNAMIVYTSRVSIGDDVYVAYGCWIQGIGGVRLEDQVMLGPYTVLATANHSKVDGSYRFGEGQYAPIHMGRGAWTGSHVVVTAGIEIGAGAACAAGAVVTRDVEPDAVVGGVPAKVIRTS